MDVHVNRVPVSGRITRVSVHAGTISARRTVTTPGPTNERSEIWIDHDGQTIVARQIVGDAGAARGLPGRDAGATVRAGDRFGIMKFGSRMDVFVPAKCEMSVRSATWCAAAKPSSRCYTDHGPGTETCRTDAVIDHERRPPAISSPQKAIRRRRPASAAASTCCPACSRWATCSAATPASSTRCAASSRRPRRSSASPSCSTCSTAASRGSPATESDFGVRVRLAGRCHLVRDGAGDPVVRLGSVAARPARLGRRLPVRGRGGDASRALQYPERAAATSATSSGCRARRRRRSRPRPSSRIRAGCSTIARRCRRWPMVLVPAVLMVSTIRFRSFKTIDLQSAAALYRPAPVAGGIIADRHASALRAGRMAYSYLASAFVGMAITRFKIPRRA